MVGIQLNSYHYKHVSEYYLVIEYAEEHFLSVKFFSRAMR